MNDSRRRTRLLGHRPPHAEGAAASDRVQEEERLRATLVLQPSGLHAAHPLEVARQARSMRHPAVRGDFQKAHLPALNRLLLRGLSKLPSAASSSVPPLRHPGLRVLNLSWCRTLNDATVAGIAVGCPGLTEVDVAWCQALTSASVAHLASRCPNLRRLSVRGCTQVAISSVSMIQEMAGFQMHS